MIPGGKNEIGREYLQALRGQGSVTPHEVVARLGVSDNCAVFWLTMLVREQKLYAEWTAP